MKRLLPLMLIAAPALAADPWADRVHDYSPGTLQLIGDGSTPGSLFDDPSQALGAPSTTATRLVGATTVVQLGQRGSITLAFDEPVTNNIPDPSSTNPLGYDFTVFGNAFELVFAGSGSFYREPGFVEVAQKQPGGGPGEWFLILPDKLPAELVGRVDTGNGAQRLAFYADVSPTIGSGDPLLPPDATGSAGGDAFLLERAVRQSAPGVPVELTPGVYDLVTLSSIDFVRITDALADDFAAEVNGVSTGLFTTDIDAVADLPGTVPEPTLLAALGLAALAGLRRARR